MPKATIAVALDLPIAVKIEEKARAEGRSISSVVNSLLKEHFKHADKQPRSGRQATVREEDQGEFGP